MEDSRVYVVMRVMRGVCVANVPLSARAQSLEAEETVRLHLASLKKDEAAMAEARRALEREKSLHIRELRRVQHEDRSRFGKHPVMHGRYLLLSLLGRGGFSEVWRAYDLKEYAEVRARRTPRPQSPWLLLSCV
jgi:tousled-like kinase